MQRLFLTLVLVVLVGFAPPALAAGGYGPPEERCLFADPAIAESSGVEAASWDDAVIWTHNDSGDAPRFFGVDTATGETVGTYDVTGAQAEDWEDMAAAEDTLYFGDIGDNLAARGSITVYEVPEPEEGASSGPVRPSAVRVFTYPDGSHNAESLLVDPTTGRLVVVTKPDKGPSGVYRAPAQGDGVMEKVADVTIPGLTTAADASSERIVIRTYLAAFEWDVQTGDTLGEVFARPPVPVPLPVARQGEAIAYSRDGTGLWTTSEGQRAPVHFLSPLAEPEPPSSTAASPATTEPPSDEEVDGVEEDVEDEEGSDAPYIPLLFTVAGLAALAAFVRRRRRTPPNGGTTWPD